MNTTTNAQSEFIKIVFNGEHYLTDKDGKIYDLQENPTTLKTPTDYWREESLEWKKAYLEMTDRFIEENKKYQELSHNYNLLKKQEEERKSKNQEDLERNIKHYASCD